MARENLKAATQKEKKDYDTRLSVNKFGPGALIYVRDSTKEVGRSPTLKLRRWNIGDLLFEVRIKPKTKSKILHHDRLKAYLSDIVPTWVSKCQKLCKAKQREKEERVSQGSKT